MYATTKLMRNGNSTPLRRRTNKYSATRTAMVITLRIMVSLLKTEVLLWTELFDIVCIFVQKPNLAQSYKKKIIFENKIKFYYYFLYFICLYGK